MAKTRYCILGVMFIAYLVCYMDRMVMASAIPFIADTFQLSPLSMGGVLSAFFIGYALMQIPGGVLADRFGPNRVLTVSVVGWSIFTALTGLAGSLTTLLLIRVLFGLSEGPFPPTASKAVALWFPLHEIGRANGLQLAAVNLGAAMAPLFVAPLIIHWGWRAVFYSLLIPGLILAFAVQRIVRDSPGQPTSGLVQRPLAGTAIGMAAVLSSPAIVWCSVTLFFTNIVTWGLMNWLPTYLLQARGFSVARMGIGASLPFLAGAVGYYLGGHFSDKYFARRRRIPIVGGLILGGAMTYWAIVASGGVATVTALMLAFLFLFVASAGLFTLPLLVVPPNAVGKAFGVVNTVGQIAAFLSPLLVGYALNITHKNFTWVFYGLVALFGVAACGASRIRQPMPESETLSAANQAGTIA